MTIEERLSRLEGEVYVIVTMNAAILIAVAFLTLRS